MNNNMILNQITAIRIMCDNIEREILAEDEIETEEQPNTHATFGSE